MTKRDDPFAEAVCRQDVYKDWSRQNRASMWDYYVDGETADQKNARHRKVRGLCFACKLRPLCRETHDAYVAVIGYQTGIWAGKVFPDKDIPPEPATVHSLALYRREDFAA
jgi:hypothetical protein